MAVYASGLLACEQIAVGDGAHLALSDIQRLLDAGYGDLADETGIALHKGIDRLRVGWLADIVGNIDREEVRSIDELVYIIQIDMICIDKILSFVAEGLDSRISFAAGLHRDGIDYLVFAV